MNYKTYIATNKGNEPEFEILCGMIVSDKFRSAVLFALEKYIDQPAAKEAVSMAFDWAHNERGYFNNGSLEYYKDITSDMFNLFECCGICGLPFTIEGLPHHVRGHLVNVHG